MKYAEKIANGIVSLYVSIETSTMKNAWKLGEKLHRADMQDTTKDKGTYKEIVKLVCSNRNVKASTLAEYKRFYVNLGTIDLKLRESYKNANPADKEMSGYVSIISRAIDSDILYTKMSLLSTIAPETMAEIFSNPETVKAINELTVPEVENFRTLVNKYHETVKNSLETAKKDKYPAFLENLSTALVSNGIDSPDTEKEPEPINAEEVLRTILHDLFELNLDDYATASDIYNAVGVVVNDVNPDTKEALESAEKQVA